jgi:hypothetical protein
MWNTGEIVVIQHVWDGLLWSARPVIVVEDRGDFVAQWCPTGTLQKVGVTPTTRPAAVRRGERLAKCLLLRDWDLMVRAWDVSTLMLTEAGAMHSTWISWLDNGDHLGWYINLQAPFERRGNRMQTFDFALDVVIEPNMQSWRWKDEDELQDLLDGNVIDAVMARAIRAEGESVIRRALAGGPPFSDPWPLWRPRREWGVPSLPPGWDEV